MFSEDADNLIDLWPEASLLRHRRSSSPYSGVGAGVNQAESIFLSLNMFLFSPTARSRVLRRN